MAEFILTHGSYLAIVAVLILTGTGLPIPEEVPVVAAGILSAHGQLDPWLAFAACLFGALAGDCVMYAIGFHFGRSVVREHPWWAHFVKPEREARIERMVEQHGLKVMFLARFLVGLRSPVYLSAGILRMPFRRFLLMDMFSATVVIGMFFGLSYRYGPTLTHWLRNAEYVLTGVVVMVLVGLGAWAYLWHRRHHKTIVTGLTDEPSEQCSAEPASETERDEQSSLDGKREESSSTPEHAA